jgi:hypothetical protein
MSLRHLLLAVLQAYLNDRQTDRFCFEVAVLFMDLAEPFHLFASLCPLPLTVAMRIAYRLLYDHIEVVPAEDRRQLVVEVCENLPREKVIFFKRLFFLLARGVSSIDTCIHELQDTTGCDPTFDKLLMLLPPKDRLHFALKYDSPLPRIDIDFGNIALTTEFLQAVADINGQEFAASLLRPDEPAEEDGGDLP